MVQAVAWPVLRAVLVAAAEVGIFLAASAAWLVVAVEQVAV
jgi:hypothetical protein